jgi:hypothetical protein
VSRASRRSLITLSPSTRDLRLDNASMVTIHPWIDVRLVTSRGAESDEIRLKPSRTDVSIRRFPDSPLGGTPHASGGCPPAASQ